MLKVIVAASFASFVAALSAASAQPTGAPSANAGQTHKPTGSYRSEMRKRHDMHKQRARAGAEYVRQMQRQ